MLRGAFPVLVAAIAFSAGVLVAAITFSVGVTESTRQAAPTESSTPAGSLSAADIAEAAGPSVVSVRADQEIGSGMIYDANGLILTNAHVVSGTHNITVTLKDGRHFAGTVVGSDPAFDIAVIGIDGASKLPTVSLGTASALEVGVRRSFWPLMISVGTLGSEVIVVSGVALANGQYAHSGAELSA